MGSSVPDRSGRDKKNEYDEWVENAPGVNAAPPCEGNCGKKAAVYAMGPYAGDWGGSYCHNCKPKGFKTTDRYDI